jgi:glutathione S-transferase
MMAQSQLGKDVRKEAMAVLSARSVVGLKMLENRQQDNEWLAGSYVMVTFALTTLRYLYLYSVAEYLNILRYFRRIVK